MYAYWPVALALLGSATATAAPHKLWALLGATVATVGVCVAFDGSLWAAAVCVVWLAALRKLGSRP